MQNEVIGFEQFIEEFKNSIKERTAGEINDEENLPNSVPNVIAFSQEFVERLCEGGDLPDQNFAYYEKKIGRANARINAYDIAEIDKRVDLVVTATIDDRTTLSPNVPASKILEAAKAALHVFRSAKRPIYEEQEPSSAEADMFKSLHQHYKNILNIRLIVLADGICRNIPELNHDPDLPVVKLDVWDHVRLARVCQSNLPYESIKIDLRKYLDRPLQYVDASAQDNDHQCLLTIFPGDLLHDLYEEYGSRLLELNVRSFLQARGKVNRGIRDTLKNDPNHFMAFNNGISTTVEALEKGKWDNGSYGIISLTGLQIVNGGQTTASIHRAKKQDKSDLSTVHVPTKITVVKPEYLDTLVPSISRFSNTQNQVNETDFSANHPYHVQLQELSQRIWAPGETTRWFYERARGQWEVARSREGTTQANKRLFDTKTPRKQKFDKTLLAKSENTWNQKPHIVSRGGQKNFVEYMSDIGDTLPNEVDYKDIICRLILFKEAEKIARQIGFSAYRANAVTYTLSLFSYRTATRINFEEIWLSQSIPVAITEILRKWMALVHEAITQEAIDLEKNVTEWAKQKDCWAMIQNLSVELPPDFEDQLLDGLPLPNVGIYRDGGNQTPLNPEQIIRQKKIMSMTSEQFQLILLAIGKHQESHGMKPIAWNAMTGCIATLILYAQNNWKKIPTPKQTNQIVKAMDFLEERDGRLPFQNNT